MCWCTPNIRTIHCGKPTCVPSPHLTAAQAPDLSQQTTTTVGAMSLHATSADYWRAQAKANAKDAARYAWLRGGKPRTTGAPKAGRIEVYQWEGRQEGSILKGDALDAAIDAAMTAKDSHAD